jgi:hypothetical protein
MDKRLPITFLIPGVVRTPGMAGYIAYRPKLRGYLHDQMEALACLHIGGPISIEMEANEQPGSLVGLINAFVDASKGVVWGQVVTVMEIKARVIHRGNAPYLKVVINKWQRSR